MFEIDSIDADNRMLYNKAYFYNKAHTWDIYEVNEFIDKLHVYGYLYHSIRWKWVKGIWKIGQGKSF